jgi:hypothetical protein
VGGDGRDEEDVTGGGGREDEVEIGIAVVERDDVGCDIA